MSSEAFCLQEPGQVMARSGKTFYLASRLLPERIRASVIALYFFCRTVDDLADDTTLPAEQRQSNLLALAAAFERADATKLREHAWPFATTGHMAGAASLLVSAALSDLDQRQPETDQDVLDYAFGVAGTVGLMMAEVLQAKVEGRGAAIALGMAMQLTNICRDVAEDARNGRFYLPLSTVRREDIKTAMKSRHSVEAALTRQAIKHLLALAEELYQQAYNGMWTLPWRTRWSITAAAMCYREIGLTVRRNVAQSWQHRVIVSRKRKLLLVALAGLRLMHPRFWRRSPHAEQHELYGVERLTQACRLGLPL